MTRRPRILAVRSLPRSLSHQDVVSSEITLVGSIGTATRRALFDDKSTYSIVPRDLAEAIGHLDPLPDPTQWTFQTPVVGLRYQARYRVALDVMVDGKVLSDEFIVLDECDDDVIVGKLTMLKWGLRLRSSRLRDGTS